MTTREQHEQYLFPNYAPLQIMPSHGKGARLWDTDGTEYIDFAAGIAVSALGHAHPELVDALHQQATKFWHVSNIMTNAPAISLAKSLVDTTFADRVYLSNSGAEANEAALKLARRYAHENFGEEKFEIISFLNSFHGRTLFTVSVGGQAKYSEGFGPKIEGITHLPFNDIDALEAAVSDKTCAIIMEPIQGEGGVRPATQAFAQRARELCDEHNALLIFDEIQTGVMRTGELYAYMGLGVEPDILTSAKGLGGGIPVAATLAKQHVADAFQVGVHGSTFGGNPLACAVANKVMELVNTPEMKAHVQSVAKQTREGLESLNREFSLFSEIRGEGLLIGCELKSEHAGRARDLLKRLMANGVLALVAGDSILRLAPPLVTTEEELHIGLGRMTQAVKAFLA
ncbi:MAG: acetylornithine/succinyldiaminopimelate transaminase [Arenicellales bacterium]